MSNEDTKLDRESIVRELQKIKAGQGFEPHKWHEEDIAQLLRLLAAEKERLGTASSPESQEAGTESSISCPKRTYQVLLVEDNILNRKFISHFLKKFGHEVIVADNGKQALERLQDTAVDVVLMDVQMPEMDGIEATRQIKKPREEGGLGLSVPVVALTAYAMQGDRERFLQAGMNDYLPKPVEQETLFEVLHRVLGHEQPPRKSKDAAREQKETSKTGFDIAALREHYQGNEERVKKLLRLADKELTEKSKALQQGLDNKDLNEMAEVAHSLVSMLGILKVQKASQRARSLQRAALAGEQDKSFELSDKLLNDLEAIIKTCQEHIDSGA